MFTVTKLCGLQETLECVFHYGPAKAGKCVGKMACSLQPPPQRYINKQKTSTLFVWVQWNMVLLESLPFSFAIGKQL